jgi:hypothetical protein
MKDLVWLEIDNLKKITDISAISKLSRLRGLSLEGSMWTTQIVDSSTHKFGISFNRKSES